MTNRRWGLDLLRTIAILSVIEGHGRYISMALGNKLKILGVTDGVDLFFVLSGFLIGSILIKDYSKHDELDVKNFWIRRWLRTLPIYYVALFVNIIFIRYVFNYGFSKRDILNHFVFFQNIIPPYNDFRFFSEAWSLSVEEFFYLSLPLAIMLIVYVTKKRDMDFVFIVSLIGLALFSICIRVFEYMKLPIENYSLEELNNRFRIIVPERLDSLAVGVFAALFRARYSSLWSKSIFKNSLFITGIIVLILLDRTQFYSGRIHLGFFAFVPSFFLYSIGVALVLPFLDSWEPKNNVITKGITQISKQSYSMYLFHNSLIAIPMKNYSPTLSSEYSKVMLYVLYWILVFLISYITYTFIEKPILNYRDRKYMQKEERQLAV